MTATESEIDDILFSGRAITDAQRQRVRELNAIIAEERRGATAGYTYSGDDDQPFVAGDFTPNGMPSAEHQQLLFRMAVHELGHAVGAVLVAARPTRIRLSAGHSDCQIMWRPWHTARHKLICWCAGPVAEMDLLGAEANTWTGNGDDDSDEVVYQELAAQYDGDALDIVHETRVLLKPMLASMWVLAHDIAPAGGCGESILKAEFGARWGRGLRSWEPCPGW
jgi:hypothetical protein